MPRVVLDTSVLVSAIISDGKSRDLMRRGVDGQFSMFESDQILKELMSVLRRPKFETSEEEIDRIILALRRTAEVVEVISRLKVVVEDPKDDVIVETAYDGAADFIVTGDRHLLDLKIWRGIKILKVEELLEILRGFD